MEKNVYKIINKLDGKIYVGKTIKTLEERFKEHINEALRYKKCIESNKNFNYESRLYPAMNKYGYENFEISLLEKLDEADDINEKEKFWIQYLNTVDPNIGYNISPGGLGGPLFKGHHHSQKTKNIISSNLKGKKQDSQFALRRCEKHKKKVQNLNTGEVFLSVKDASTFCGSSVRNGKYVKGYWWIYLENDNSDGYTKTECYIIIKKLEEEQHIRRSNAAKKGYQTYINKTDEESRKKSKEEAIEKSLKTKKDWSNERKKEYSEKMSNIRLGKKHSSETIEKLKDYYKQADVETLKQRREHISEGLKGKKRYINIYDQTYKMFIPGTEPEGWILLPHKGGAINNKRKYRNKLTGKCKMFFPEEVDLNIWEKVVKE